MIAPATIRATEAVVERRGRSGGTPYNAVVDGPQAQVDALESVVLLAGTDPLEAARSADRRAPGCRWSGRRVRSGWCTVCGVLLEHAACLAGRLLLPAATSAQPAGPRTRSPPARLDRSRLPTRPGPLPTGRDRQPGAVRQVRPQRRKRRCHLSRKRSSRRGVKLGRRGLSPEDARGSVASRREQGPLLLSPTDSDRLTYC